MFIEGLECCCRDDVLWQRVPDIVTKDIIFAAISTVCTTGTVVRFAKLKIPNDLATYSQVNVSNPAETAPCHGCLVTVYAQLLRLLYHQSYDRQTHKHALRYSHPQSRFVGLTIRL